MDHQCIVFASFSQPVIAGCCRIHVAGIFESIIVWWFASEWGHVLSNLRILISSVSSNTTTLCNDTKGGTYLSSKATLFCKWKWKCLSCPSHTFSALTVRFNKLVLWNNAIAVLLPSAVDKVRPSFVYSTIVKCDSAPCLYVSNYVYKLWIRVLTNPADNTIPCLIFTCYLLEH